VAVTGIGGLFFRSRDPEARAAWYREHLGMAAGHDSVWEQQAGMTVFAPFPADSDYFPADQTFMLNLRVTDLDALVGALESAGIAVERRPEWETEYGRFVRIHDPEGLPIELWEEPTPDESVD
jgi:catechol 2,3-dioxygenase-like lactoylglutathione lyase family enzyme